MNYNKEDVFAYQILECLVSDYHYKIVNVPGGKKDLWLANEQSILYPMIRISGRASSSAIFEKDYLERITFSLANILQSERPLLILNTNDESHEYQEDDFIQMVITNTKKDERLNSIFPKLDGKIHVVSDNKAECNRVIHHINDIQKEKEKEYKKEHKFEKPFVSIGITVICLVIVLGFTYIYSQSDDATATMILFGANFKGIVHYGHEYWRFISAGFVHQSILDVCCYGIALYTVGSILESKIGRIQYLVIFLVSIIASNLFTYICAQNVLVLGMAPGICGLVGALSYYIYSSKTYKISALRMHYIQIVGLSLIICAFGGTTIYGVIASYVVGFFLGIVFDKFPSTKPFKIHALICTVLLFMMGGYFAYNVHDVYPTQASVNKSAISIYEKYGLTFESERLEKVLPMNEEE